ncbi:hypothetical protein BJX99DRAFT_66612 [Aspergillus californicus]
MKLTTLPLLFLFGLSLAAPSEEECDLIATYTQNQLSNIAPLLAYSANSLENSGTQSASTSTANYLNAAADALSQIDTATGPSADQFRREITEACRQGGGNSKIKREDAVLVRQVYGSLAEVSRQSPHGETDGLGGILDGLLGTVGNLLNEVLKAVDNLLDNLGLGDLLGDLLGGIL